MSIIKRLYTSISASVDQLVGEIENHDALIEAAIREQRKKLAAAKVQLKRIRDREQQAAADIDALECRRRQWQDRALRVAAEDETRALGCLQQRDQVVQQQEQLRRYREQYRRAVRTMSEDIGRCERELCNLDQKHTLFRARQSSSDALSVVNDMGAVMREDLATCFERWDATITEREFGIDAAVDEDEFERAFVDDERRAQLQRELAQLRSGGPGHE